MLLAISIPFRPVREIQFNRIDWASPHIGSLLLAFALCYCFICHGLLARCFVLIDFVICSTILALAQLSHTCDFESHFLWPAYISTQFLITGLGVIEISICRFLLFSWNFEITFFNKPRVH